MNKKDKPVPSVKASGIAMKREKLTRLAAALLRSGICRRHRYGFRRIAQAARRGRTVHQPGLYSCPPADALFTELVRKGEVVALAYHVDYWDYLGWRDTLAKPENTDERQRDYGRAFGIRSVYTPQAVINGRVHVNGAKKWAVKARWKRY